MYKLTEIMLQNLEKNLKQFHDMFSGGRCQAWQLEELIAKAIRSDFSKSDKVVWSGNGHDIKADIIVNDIYKIQIKSGQIKNNKLVISGHRLGRFNGDLLDISDFLNNEAKYIIISVPYERIQDNRGIVHRYYLYYIDTDKMQIENANNWQKSGKSYTYINNNNIEMKISPSMSWQIWWSIPIEIINSADNVKIIEIC